MSPLSRDSASRFHPLLCAKASNVTSDCFVLFFNSSYRVARGVASFLADLGFWCSAPLVAL